MSSDVDWVSKRSKCSVATVFENLKLQVKEDVEERKTLIPADARFGFVFASGANSFSVSLLSDPIQRTVTFERDRSTITVSEGDTALMAATLTLNDEGNCRLKTGGKELELWQFRRKALEEIFFSAFP